MIYNVERLTMALIDDGDLIRGLGFVALYAAYLEEAVDECLSVVAARDLEVNRNLYRRPTSQKIEYIQHQLQRLEPLSEELAKFPEILQAIGELLEERNLVIHGRVYAIPGVGDVRISGRPGVPETQATSAELYVLANDLYSARGPLLQASMFSLRRQFEAVYVRDTGDAQPVVAGGAPPIGGAPLY